MTVVNNAVTVHDNDNPVVLVKTVVHHFKISVDYKTLPVLWKTPPG